MKLLYRFLAIGLLSLIVNLSAYSNHCGNGDKYGCDHLGNCPKTGSCTFAAFPGNEHRAIMDLVVQGSISEIPLIFTRYANSRYGAFPRPFGLAHNWNHSFNYTMYDGGADEQGRLKVVIHYPEGGDNTFTQDASNLNLWLPLPGIDKRIFQQGNNFFLQMSNGHRYRFEKLIDPNHTVWPTENNTNVYYQLQDIRDNYQNLYKLDYDDEHKLIRITEPAGRYIHITYGFVNGWKVITQVITSDGRRASYNYDLFHDEVHSWIRDWVRLISVDYGDGTKARYSYWQSEPGKGPNLEHAIDPRLIGNSVNVRYTYDPSVTEGFIKEERNGITGEVLATLNTSDDNRFVCYSNGRVQHLFVPDELLGALKEYTDGLGRVTKYTYSDGELGFLESTTDALGRTTTYLRTIYGNPLEVTHPDGSKEKWTRDDLDQILTYTDGLNRVTKYTRDNRHRVTRVRYPDGTAERFTYNSFSQVLTHTMRNGGVERNIYDSRGLKTSYTNALDYSTLYTYDSADRLASKTDARGNTTKYEYNERGLITKMTNADNSFQKFRYDDYGNKISTTNELGNPWTMLYDEFKRVISSHDPLKRETQYKYDLPGGGCGCSHDNGSPTKIILPSGKVTAFTYDVEWQKTAETAGAGTADAATTHYEYDSEGNLVTKIDPKGKNWTYAYDVRNRLISSTDPLGHKTEWSYDVVGNMLVQKRPDGGMRVNVYDEMNRPIQTTDPKGETTSMRYDGEGNMIRLTDANARNYNFEYDLLNRKKRMTYPGGSYESYAYDAVGNLRIDTNRAGDVRTYTYDNRNRETHSDWSDNTPDISSNYDAASRLLSLSSSVSLLTYTYDAADELTSETQAIAGAGGGAKTISYGYNADGLTSALSYPGNSTIINYSYTGRNQVKNITASGMSNIATTYNYDLNGNRTGKSYDNGTSTIYTYDNKNRTLKVDNQKGGVSFASFDYGYDNVNRRIYVKRDGGKGDLYAYNATDQLTDVQYEVTNPEGGRNGPIRTQSYYWDAVGNRDSVTDNGTITTYTTNNRNQYTQIDSNALGYNANGALRTFDGWTFGYDAQDRLIRAEKGRTLLRFAYDARNRRVRQVVNGVVSYLYYNGWSLIEESNQVGTLKAQYINSMQVDEILTKTSSLIGSVYYHHDALGNVTQLTNGLGNVVEYYTYNVFGTVNIRNESNHPITVSAFDNRFMFTGREFIQEVGLYDYRNRMYSAQLGRFIQADPLRLAAKDYNLYRYVNNNPINYRDPFGLETVGDWDFPEPRWNTSITDFGTETQVKNRYPNKCCDCTAVATKAWVTYTGAWGIGFSSTWTCAKVVEKCVGKGCDRPFYTNSGCKLAGQASLKDILDMIGTVAEVAALFL